MQLAASLYALIMRKWQRGGGRHPRICQETSPYHMVSLLRFFSPVEIHLRVDDTVFAALIPA